MSGIKFPELEQLERIIEQLGDRAQIEIVERIQYKAVSYTHLTLPTNREV